MIYTRLAAVGRALTRRSIGLISRLTLVRGKPRRGAAQREVCSSVKDVIDTHFGSYADREHPCKTTLSRALHILGGKRAVIIETGSSAWGSNSSMLFDLYVSSFGGSFDSVDLRAEPSFTLSRKCSSRSRFWVGDSCDWISSLSDEILESPDLVYLDSWDVNPVCPVDSAMHGLSEFIRLIPFLRAGSLVLIDDTPVDYDTARMVQGDRWASDWLESSKRFGFPPGKGSLVLRYIRGLSGFEVVEHKYQLLIRV